MTSALLLTASSITLRNGACQFHASAPMDKHPTPRCNNQSHSNTPAVLNVAVSPTITVDPEQHHHILTGSYGGTDSTDCSAPGRMESLMPWMHPPLTASDIST